MRKPIMDRREKLEDRGDVPSVCSMCKHACIQEYELKNGQRRIRTFCSHPRDGGVVVFKVLSCNLFELLSQEPKKQ